MLDGCTIHAQAEAVVARRWAQAEQTETPELVGYCRCCWGPCLVEGHDPLWAQAYGMFLCTLCRDAAPEQLALNYGRVEA